MLPATRTNSSQPPARRIPPGHEPARAYKYFPLVMPGFVTVLLCSNLIGPGKSCQITLHGFARAFGAGHLFFPLSSISDNVLPEVYGDA